MSLCLSRNYINALMNVYMLLSRSRSQRDRAQAHSPLQLRHVYREHIRVDVVEAELALLLFLHEACIEEFFQVVRDGWLGYVEEGVNIRAVELRRHCQL